MSDRTCANLDQIPDALAKTGFILEHHVAEEFKRSGWWTIGGRYYADDVDGRARELDLVAYRTDKSKDLEVVTAVLVSCKKDEQTTWTFLTKDKPKHDPNFDWDPIHYWTDVQPLQAYLASESWKEKYLSSAGNLYEKNFKANTDIFAFQQIDSKKITAQNDKSIYDSIVSLMKALDHEVDAVPIRAKGRNRLYLFSLLSVVDAPMVKVNYSEKKPTAIEVEQMTHLARYMVKRRELSALIHFVRSDRLPQFIDSLSKLSNANFKHLTSLVSKSYDAIRSNSKVRAHFTNVLKSRLVLRIDRSLRKTGRSVPKFEEASLGFEDGKLIIHVDIYDDDDLESLNNDKSLAVETAKLLKDIARYEGAFMFESDIPF